MENESDAQLAERAVSGDDASFAMLMRRYQNAVYEMCCRMLRDREAGLDAAQEVFLKAHSALPRYDGSRRFSTWIFAICRNHCIDEIRRPSRRLVTPLQDDGRKTPASGPNPSEIAEQAQTSRLLEKTVDRLPEHYREAVMLYHYQELSYAEAAEIQGVPMGTFMARLHRARRMLRDQLRPIFRS